MTPFKLNIYGELHTFTSNHLYNRTLVGNKIVDHSDVVRASPVGTAPTASLFSTQHLASMDYAKPTARRDDNYLNFRIWCLIENGRYLSLSQYIHAWFVRFVEVLLWYWMILPIFVKVTSLQLEQS